MNCGRGNPARKGEIGDDVRLIMFSPVPLSWNSTTPLRSFLFIFLIKQIEFFCWEIFMPVGHFHHASFKPFEIGWFYNDFY